MFERVFFCAAAGVSEKAHPLHECFFVKSRHFCFYVLLQFEDMPWEEHLDNPELSSSFHQFCLSALRAALE